MTESLDIKINLSSTFWREAPKTRVWVDDNLLLDGAIISPVELSWQGTLEDGEHSIRIELYGKEYVKETILEDGKIIKDQLLNIDDIFIDDISLSRMLYNLNKYAADTGVTHYNIINLGWNGTWEIKFHVPIYVWFLENL
jgi:hypothetical protein